MPLNSLQGGVWGVEAKRLNSPPLKFSDFHLLTGLLWLCLSGWLRNQTVEKLDVSLQV